MSSNNNNLPPIAPTPGKPSKASKNSTTTTTTNNTNTNTTATNTTTTTTAAADATTTAVTTITTAAAANDLSTQISPPGMRLRSGRKKKPTPSKRRRDDFEQDVSTTTTMTTAKTTVAAEVVVEDEKDEEMKENQQKEEMTTVQNVKRGNKRKLDEDDDEDENNHSNSGGNNGNNGSNGKNGNNAENDEDDKPMQKIVKKAKISKDDDDDAGADAGADADADADANDVDIEMKSSFATADNGFTTGTATGTDAQPSITNINLTLPTTTTITTNDNNDTAMDTTASTSTTTAAVAAEVSISSPPQPSNVANGNTRIRNFFTPFVKKKVDSEKESDNEKLVEAKAQSTISPPVTSFQQRLEESTTTTTTAAAAAAAITTVDTIREENTSSIDTIKNNQNTTTTTSTTNTSSTSTTPGEGRVNGLFHYYFKRTIDRLTPIPVQFKTTTVNNDNDSIVRPEPIRTTSGVHLDQLGVGGASTGANTTGVSSSINVHDEADNGNRKNDDEKKDQLQQQEKDDQIIVQHQNEETDDIDQNEDDIIMEGLNGNENDSSSSSPLLASSSKSSPFHKVQTWIVLLHIIYGLFGKFGISSTYDGGHSSVLSKSILAIPNIAKYQYENWYGLGKIDGGGAYGDDDVVATAAASAEDMVCSDAMTDLNGTIVEDAEEEEDDDDETPEPIIKTEEEIVEEIVLVDNIDLEETERELFRQRRLIEQYKEEKAFIQQNEEKLTEATARLERRWNLYIQSQKRINDLKDQLSKVDESLKSNSQSLSDTASLLTHGKGIMQQLLDEDADGTDKSLLIDLFDLSVQNLSEESDILDIDATHLKLLPLGSSVSIPGEGCKGQSNIVEVTKHVRKIQKKKNTKTKKKGRSSPKLDWNEAIDAVEDLEDEIEILMENMFESSKLTQVALNWFTSVSKDYLAKWMEESLPNLEDVTIANTDNLVKETESSGISKEGIQVIIDRLLEIESADSTGKYDYASIGNGASVIRTGSRKTSLSIVDNLPLINQFLSKTSLKFYGHGAEAALVPTYPKTALGQCWSFEEEGVRKHLAIKEMIDDNEVESMTEEIDRGDYATLSVRLAKPIHVSSVIIEHPSKLLSASSMQSAIREFRLIGHMTEEADGDDSWALGTFVYQSGDGLSSMQEFKVKTVDQSGLPVPKLSSITLAIDSNWGGEHTCLYRFRVQGSE